MIVTSKNCPQGWLANPAPPWSDARKFPFLRGHSPTFGSLRVAQLLTSGSGLGLSHLGDSCVSRLLANQMGETWNLLETLSCR